MIQIEELIQGKEIVYEDKQDIVRFSVVGGQIQKTITYKTDWFDNKGQPVKAGDVVQITGDEAIAELLKNREFLSYFKVEESTREVSEEDKNRNREFLSGIQPLIEGKEMVYEDKQDIVRFSVVGGKIQKTITYKKDWIDNKGQPVKAGKVVQITGDEAIAELLNDRDYLSYFKVEESARDVSEKSDVSDRKNSRDLTFEEMSSNVKKIDSEEIMPIDESKFAQIYGKARGRIKEVLSKIKKAFFNVKSNDNNDKTNDENVQ